MKRLIFVATIVCFILIAQGQNATATLINFDVGPDGSTPVANLTNINTLYSSLGVTFGCFNGTDLSLNICTGASTGGNAYALASIAANSAPNVIGFSTGTLTGVFFDERFGYLKASFSSPVSSVSIDAKAVLPPEYLGTTTNNPFKQAFS